MNKENGPKGKLPLSVTHPELAKQAFGWDPSKVTAGSGSRVQWRCQFGHLWFSKVYNRAYGTGCPVCSGRQVLTGFNDLLTTDPEVAKEAFGWDPSLVPRSSNKKKEWICYLGHQWISTINNRTLGKGCPVCGGRQVLEGFNDLETTEPELAKQAFGWNPKLVARGTHSKRDWRCAKGHRWSATVVSRAGGSGCPTCSGHQVLEGYNDLLTEEPELAIQALGWDPKTITRSSGIRKEWKCNLGHQWSATVANRTAGRGCPVCSGKKVLEGFNDLATTDPEIAKQALGWDPKMVTRSSNLKKLWKCEFKHEWKTSINHRTRPESCPVCIGQKVLVGFNDLLTLEPEIAKQAFGWDPTTVTRGSSLVREWQCGDGHKWKTSVAHRTIEGNGCPSCSITGFDPNSQGWIYFLYHPQWQMLQIGISNFPDDRLKKHKKLGWKLLELRGPMDGHLTQQWETAILRMLKAKGADLSNAKIAGRFDGYSEAWSKSTFEIKSIKELMRLTEEFEGN
jgi:hypothetical protein